jgi:hypothetical protein
MIIVEWVLGILLASVLLSALANDRGGVSQAG